MSQFIDDLTKIAPGVSTGCQTTLESLYGSVPGFCAGLDIFARIIQQGTIPKQIPAFGEPWRSIYLDTLSGIQSQGKQLKDAYQAALSMDGRPTLELYDAINCRLTELTEKGRLSKDRTMEDYQAALLMLGYSLRKNLAGNHIEVNGHTMTDEDESEIRMRMEDAGFTGKQRITDTILTSAELNKYHPVKDYLNSLKWDGVPRIEKLASYFYARQAGIFPKILRKWLIGAVCKVMRSDQNPMLVLEGPQGCGKGTFTRWLCFDEKYHKESSIDPDNKDHRIATSEIFIWEVGELGSTTKRQDREALKSFLTTSIFMDRPAYGRHNQQYIAMSSFIGTVNNENGFLNDPTGSRRFWVLGIDGINWKYIEDLKADDIWAEAVAAYNAGETNVLDDTLRASMEDIADEYRVINSTEEAIKKWFIITDPIDVSVFTDFNTIREILQDPTKGNLSSRDASDIKIASALKALGLYSDRQYIPQVALGHNKKILMRGYVGIKPV